MVSFAVRPRPFVHSATEIIQGFQNSTRAALPAWGSLLYIYAVFLVPTLFAFGVGINMLVWSASRINYVFIFGKDPATFLHISDKLSRVGC
jgi:hypothetical protein